MESFRSGQRCLLRRPKRSAVNQALLRLRQTSQHRWATLILILLGGKSSLSALISYSPAAARMNFPVVGSHTSQTPIVTANLNNHSLTPFWRLASSRAENFRRDSNKWFQLNPNWAISRAVFHHRQPAVRVLFIPLRIRRIGAGARTSANGQAESSL